jgi:hypothetical protein
LPEPAKFIAGILNAAFGLSDAKISARSLPFARNFAASGKIPLCQLGEQIRAVFPGVLRVRNGVVEQAFEMRRRHIVDEFLSQPAKEFCGFKQNSL